MKHLGQGWTHGVSVTQEFGTVGSVSVIKACSRENAAWSVGASPEESRAASQNVRDVFYCRTSSWQESIMKRGITRLKRTLSHLEDHEKHPLPEVTSQAVY